MKWELRLVVVYVRGTVFWDRIHPSEPIVLARFRTKKAAIEARERMLLVHYNGADDYLEARWLDPLVILYRDGVPCGLDDE